MTVVSKSATEKKQWKWESQAGSSFTITPDDDSEEPIVGSSGTRITLHLKVKERNQTDK